MSRADMDSMDSVGYALADSEVHDHISLLLIEKQYMTKANVNSLTFPGPYRSKAQNPRVSQAAVLMPL